MRQLTTEYECFTLRWKWDYGATVTDSTLSHLTICTSQACQEEAGISSSLQFLLQLRNVLKKEYTSVPDLLLWLSRDSHTFQHTILFWNQKHASFLKTQSLTSEVLGNCVVCLLECDELACSHPVLASFLLHGFFSTVQPDPGMDRGEAGAQESVWHNCNNWGSVCEASRWERERENRSAVMVCITGRDDYTLVTYTHYSLWATLLNGDWVWACICIRLSLSGMGEEQFELWPQCGHIEDLRTLCNNETLLFTVMAVKVHSHWQPLNRWRSESRCAVGL